MIHLGLKLRLKQWSERQLKRGLKRLPKSWADYMYMAQYGYFPPGHFYSPIPDVEEVWMRREKIWQGKKKKLPGIKLYLTEQKKLVGQMMKYYEQLPFDDKPSGECRYYYNNGSFTHTSGIFLYLMLRQFKPKRVIEVGSGYSTALMVEVKKRNLPDLEITCVEPFPHVLRKLLGNELDEVRLVKKPVWEVDLREFRKLGRNDVLFIDSTHVSKVGSDVNYLFFEVLPSLRTGVLVHIHDVMWPFEYPQEWIREGRAFNEQYLLRAFLEFNQDFEVVVFDGYLKSAQRKWLEEKMPLVMGGDGGSIWLRRV